jgi:hypothetical protein
LNTPATTPSGFLHGMVVAHIAGQGAPELVRYFKEPPLVREPDIALFGLSRVDPGEQKWMDVSPMRKFTPDEIRELGPAAAAEAALERIHIFKRQWVLHFDVDVLAASEMPATYYPAADGLRGAEFAEALGAFASNPNLAAVTIASYVPSADADGAAAARLLDLFAGAMAARYRALTAAQVPEAAPEAKEVAEVLEVADVKKEASSALETVASASVSEVTITEDETPLAEAQAAVETEARGEEVAETASEAAPAEIADAAGEEVVTTGADDSAADASDETVSEEKSEGG